MRLAKFFLVFFLHLPLIDIKNYKNLKHDIDMGKSDISGTTTGGGDGVLDLDSGIFTCITPGYYTVSFSGYGHVGPDYGAIIDLSLYKNGIYLPGSRWQMWGGFESWDSYGKIGAMGSRILVSSILESF